jgi:hypothetical protein
MTKRLVGIKDSRTRDENGVDIARIRAKPGVDSNGTG